MEQGSESSDAPSVPAMASDEAAPSKRRTIGDYVALAIATCGVGYIPLAPGTWGSVVGVGMYVVLRWLALFVLRRVDPLGSGLPAENLFLAIELVAIVVVTLVGIWAASLVERLEARKDPAKVVIDEVAGQLIALLPIGLTLTWSWRVWTIAAFILFRAFDIIKPYPVRKLESLPSGLGIVVDDLGAGAYAAVVLAVAIVAITFR